jgi:hypothetical protein
MSMILELMYFLWKIHKQRFHMSNPNKCVSIVVKLLHFNCLRCKTNLIIMRDLKVLLIIFLVVSVCFLWKVESNSWGSHSQRKVAVINKEDPGTLKIPHLVKSIKIWNPQVVAGNTSTYYKIWLKTPKDPMRHPRTPSVPLKSGILVSLRQISGSAKRL